MTSFKEDVFHDLMKYLDKRIEKFETPTNHDDPATIARQKVLIELLQMKTYVSRRFADYNSGLAIGVEIGEKEQIKQL